MSRTPSTTWRATRPTTSIRFRLLGELLRQRPQGTIVKLAGLAPGGGTEFVAAADMAFAAEGHAGLAQCEASMGITPEVGGTQYLSSRMTRGRALEVILGGDLIDASTAERYGWIHRALPAAALDGFVDRLARNIAALPAGVIAAAKQAVPPVDLRDGYRREQDAWAGLFQRPAAGKLIRGGLDAGAQTRAGERNLEGLLRALQI